VLSGPEAITFDRVAETLGAAIGRDVAFADVPDEAARAAMLQAGAPAWIADNVVAVYGALRAGVATQVTDTVRQVTGRAPRSLEQFAREHAGVFSAPLEVAR
jgi:uncharacterized protein YbjT (DUF2867 family)